MSSPTAEHAYHPAMRGVANPDRHQRHLERWRRHSRRIRLLRRLLPVAIVVLLVGLLGWSGINTLLLRMSAGSQVANMGIRMVNPKFLGRDQGGRPFSVGAALAVRDAKQPQVIYLDRPIATLGAHADSQTHTEADHGVYHEDTHILMLDGHVHLHDMVNDFVSPRAVVNIATNDVDGPAPVQGRGGFGRIASNTYAVRNKGDDVYFNGRVSAHIIQGSAARAPKGPR